MWCCFLSFLFIFVFFFCMYLYMNVYIRFSIEVYVYNSLCIYFLYCLAVKRTVPDLCCWWTNVIFVGVACGCCLCRLVNFYLIPHKSASHISNEEWVILCIYVLQIHTLAQASLFIIGTYLILLWMLPLRLFCSFEPLKSSSSIRPLNGFFFGVWVHLSLSDLQAIQVLHFGV